MQEEVRKAWQRPSQTAANAGAPPAGITSPEQQPHTPAANRAPASGGSKSVASSSSGKSTATTKRAPRKSNRKNSTTQSAKSNKSGSKCPAQVRPEIYKDMDSNQCLRLMTGLAVNLQDLDSPAGQEAPQEQQQQSPRVPGQQQAQPQVPPQVQIQQQQLSPDTPLTINTGLQQELMEQLSPGVPLNPHVARLQARQQQMNPGVPLKVHVARPRAQQRQDMLQNISQVVPCVTIPGPEGMVTMTQANYLRLLQQRQQMGLMMVQQPQLQLQSQAMPMPGQLQQNSNAAPSGQAAGGFAQQTPPQTQN